MVTITLELTDEQLKKAIEDAKQKGLTVQELALLRLLCVPLPAEPAGGMDFEGAMKYVFDKNSELYRRLA